MKIKVFGIPSQAGALFDGTEQAPKAIRDAGLVERLSENHIVEDYGDLVNYNTLPRHNVAPVRNWPAPRIVWDAIEAKTEELFDSHSFSIILGGDCSIEVGTFTSFRKVFGEKSYLLVVDGHVDTIPPTGDKCIGAAAMGLWFLTQDQKVWWKEQPVAPTNMMVIGPHVMSEDHFGINVVPLQEVTSKIEEVLKGVHEDGYIFIHFDVDALHESVMPSAYSPSKEGMDFEEAAELLGKLFKDHRVKGIEVTEFSANKDTEGRSAKVIVDLLCLIPER
jgi:arginase